MLPSEFEGFVKYAIGICVVVAILALWRVRKRGPSALLLVGGALAFALLLYMVLVHVADPWLYAIGTVAVMFSRAAYSRSCLKPRLTRYLPCSLSFRARSGFLQNFL